jgi:hypothetical protein
MTSARRDLVEVAISIEYPRQVAAGARQLELDAVVID